METTSQSYQDNLLDSIGHTLKLITNVNDTLLALQKTGEKEDGLMIRQYRHLKRRLTEDLMRQLSRFDLPVDFTLK